jgi:putative ABC transport system permease protein
MKILKLIFKNTLRHKLRTILTILGIAVAVIAFGLLRTVVTAWYVGIEGSQADRLITRHAVSFIFPLPYSYLDKIKQMDEVENVSFFNWFGGIYIDKNQFFARFAADANSIFDVYPEWELTEKELQDFKSERNATVIGKDIANQYGLKIGDPMTLEGDIFPGRWDFVIRGIYEPKFKHTDATAMIFHWEYLNERMVQESPERANNIGWFAVRIKNADDAAIVSEKIDALFANSPAETITETERAFQQGFLASSSAIIEGMNAISFIIVGIIMLVLGNTMIMAARERTREYAVLKTLGFSGSHLLLLIMGESLFISLIGGGVGLALTFPIVAFFESVIPKGFFPIFQIEPITVMLAVAAILIIGIASAVFPVQRAISTKIVDGFRFVG